MKELMHFKRLDWGLIGISFLLAIIGLTAIYSSSLGRGDFLNFKKQTIFLVIGLFLMILLSFFDWRWFRDDPYFILALYFICLVLLAGLFFFAPEIRGVQAWYKIGPFSLDPIEFTKIILIVMLAKYFSLRHIEMYRIIHIFISGLYVFFPAILIFFQPDLGSVLILVGLWTGILIISGIKLRHFIILALCGILIMILGWSSLLKDYQKERVMNFLRPQISDSLNVGWSQQQAKIAIGSGGLFGKGISKGPQTQYGFLPEPQTDFIFSVIAEETGLIGVGVLMSLFLSLIWKVLQISSESKSNFCRLFATGLSIMILSQLFVHIGMNLGILPIIGISMPLVSYGGSGLIALFIGLGIIQSMKRTG